MASEQPQPSSEKFTSYEYGIEYSSSCDNSSPRVGTGITGVVESDQNSKRLNFTWRLCSP
jgi:hypothetical protein